MLRPVIFKWDGSTWTDLTSNVKTTSTFNWLSASTDIIYIGLDRRYTGLYIDLSTNGSYTGITFSAWDSENWTAVEEIVDYNFDSDKFSQWNMPDLWSKEHFTDTWPHASSPPDNVDRYWIKVSCSDVATTAVIEKIRCLPYCMYSTPKMVASRLGLPEIDMFNINTSPLTEFEVEDFISEAQDDIDYELKSSWQFRYVPEELHEFNLEGIKLYNDPIFKVYSLYVWDGASWETKTQGRQSDYFTNDLLGMIYFSRYFLLPARLAYVGPHWWGWGVGEFIFAIKVAYAYGYDWETDRKFKKIQDIATKKAALKVLDATQYLALLPSGAGGRDMNAIADNWRMEIEEDLEKLRPMVVF